jgi:putative selenium metabolism hydrolase
MHPVVPLAQSLIRAPSPSGAEGPAAEALLTALAELDFDRSYVDDAGNVVGLFERGSGPHVMLNGHIDTVPLGDPALWPHPPLSGAIIDGRLWGRGACDMKGSVAAMALAARAAAERGFTGTLSVTGVVQEEIGGLGARYLIEQMAPDVVVLGEPSSLGLKLGHRGRVEVEVAIPGAIAHAAKPELGDNALYRAARYLLALEGIELPIGGPLGRSTVAATRLRSLPEDGANVVPGRALITVDYRNLPDDEPDDVVRRLGAIDPGAVATVHDLELRSWKGLTMHYPKINPAYLAPGENRSVGSARAALRSSLARLGRPFDEGVWWFATDAPYLSAKGAPVIGFGPGEEALAHTTNESIDVGDLVASVTAYTDLALGLFEGGIR